MDCEDLVGAEGYNSTTKRAEHIEKIDALIEDWLEGRSKSDVIETLLEANVLCAPVQTVDDPI